MTLSFAEVGRELRARWPETRLEPSTERIEALMDLLGHPQRSYPVIHVTGTNGKSSTARMIDALLRQQDLRVGRFTSPHLETVRERISVDGQPLSADRFVEAYEEVRPYVELVDSGRDVPMSFFEVLTGMAYATFADAPVDVAVVEVGMGGSWDATNVVDGAVAVVTPIAIDHTQYLGDTIEEVASEKAGIIKPGAVAVLAQQNVTAAEILMRRAGEVDAVVAREGIEFGVTARDLAISGQQLEIQGLRATYDEIFLPLFGEHQAGNAACAVAAVEAFTGGGKDLDPDLIRAAFATASSPGRLERVRASPTVLVDAAHNPAGMAATADALSESFAFTRLIGVVAVMVDKDVVGILEALEPVLTEVVVTRNSAPRSMDVDEIAGIAGEMFGPERVHSAERLDDAIDLAVAAAEETGELHGSGVLVTGSVITAGDARRLLGADGVGL